MKDTIEILSGARELLTPPSAWCQGRVTKMDEDCVNVVARCAIGAVATLTKVPSEARTALKELAIEGNLTPSSAFIANATADLAADPIDNNVEAYLVAHWNDAPDRRHAEVLDLFDRTIARLKTQRRGAIVDGLLTQAHAILAEIEKADAPQPVLVSDAA